MGGLRRRPLDEAILDEALTLALAFGPDWLEPVQDRLAQRHPKLSRAELDRYDAQSRRVRDAAQKRVGTLARGTSGPESIHEQWRAEIEAKHPWISEANLSHLFSQACYYLRK